MSKQNNKNMVINRISVNLLHDETKVDGFSLSTTPKSRLAKLLVAVIGKIITKRRKRG